MGTGGEVLSRLNQGGVVIQRRTLLLGCGTVATSMLFAGEARAGANDQPYPVGELASTMGGAAVAIIHDGASSWYNPAGLGRVTEEGISATLNVYGLQMERMSFCHGKCKNALASRAFCIENQSVLWAGTKRAGPRNEITVVPTGGKNESPCAINFSRQG
jgi:hypothetical protein